MWEICNCNSKFHCLFVLFYCYYAHLMATFRTKLLAPSVCLWVNISMKNEVFDFFADVEVSRFCWQFVFVSVNSALLVVGIEFLVFQLVMWLNFIFFDCEVHFSRGVPRFGFFGNCVSPEILIYLYKNILYTYIKQAPTKGEFWGTPISLSIKKK